MYTIPLSKRKSRRRSITVSIMIYSGTMKCQDMKSINFIDALHMITQIISMAQLLLLSMLRRLQAKSQETTDFHRLIALAIKSTIIIKLSTSLSTEPQTT